MSYNKFLNKILNNQNNGNVLAFNTQNQSLSFKNNIQISQFQNENIKIESNDLSTLVFSKAEGINSSLAFQENLNYSKLKISDFSFENSGDNKLFLLKNENSKIRVNSDLEISSSNFKVKKIYGNLTYVDKERTIPWLSGSSSETVKVSFNPTGGYTINRQNTNLYNMTYVTCNPMDGFSNYPISDIVSSPDTTYNFVNEEGVYTNTLYLRPGKNLNNKNKYLSSNEHTFIVDIQQSALPDWGFEESHPVLNIPNYSSIKDQILSNDIIKKNSQSIALDMSALVDTNSISTGYRINIFFRNLNQSESLPCIFHSNNNSINIQDGLWENFTFDSRYCYIEKNDFDAMTQVQKDYFKISSGFFPTSILTNVYNQITSSIYTVPYYNTLPLPNSTNFKSGNLPGVKDNGPKSGTFHYHFYRQTGTFSENRIILNYFKPKFYINLGNENIILNENSKIKLKKNIDIKINTNPFVINNSMISLISSIFNKSLMNFKYFISRITNNKNNENISSHANLADQNFSTISAASYYSHSSVVFNCSHNLTLKIKSQNIDLLKKFEILSFYQKMQTKTSTYEITGKRTYGDPFTQENIYYANILRTKNIFNIPFNNLINNENITKHTDWYYLDFWKMDKSNYIVSNAASTNIDLSLKDVTIENAFSNTPVIIKDDFGMSDYLQDYTKNEFSTQFPLQLSFMYVGFNSTTNKHEWVYV